MRIAAERVPVICVVALTDGYGVAIIEVSKSAFTLKRVQNLMPATR